LIHVDSGAFDDLDGVHGFTAPIESGGAGTSRGYGNKFGFLDRDEVGRGAVRPGSKTSRRGKLKTHFAAKTKGSRADLEISCDFENQNCFRFFLPSCIDQGLGCVCGAGGKRNSVNFFFGSGNKGCFGRGEKLFRRMGLYKGVKRKGQEKKGG
jgi:hypothetical protein